MLCDYLKEYFKSRGISQYEIERRTNINRTKINLSFNHNRKLTADELMIIAIVFDVNLEEIKKEIIQSPNKK